MKQITIPTKNRAGELADVMMTLADLKVGILTIDAQEGLGEFGWIILTVDLYDVALEGLRKAGYQPVSEDALVISLIDEPGALAKIALRFKDSNLNLRSLHILRRVSGHIHVSLVADDQVLAAQLVQDSLVRSSQLPDE